MKDTFTVKEAVAYLNARGLTDTVNTLYQRRHWRAEHPASAKIGSALVYTKEALDEYIQDRKEGREHV